MKPYSFAMHGGNVANRSNRTVKKLKVSKVIAEQRLPLSLRFQRVEKGPLLDQAYELRFRVYCVDRGFLPADYYQDGREIDEFDCNSAHFVALDAHGQVVGTSRLVMNSDSGFPLDRYCDLPRSPYAFGVPRGKLGEISRLAVHVPGSRSSTCGADRRADVRRTDIALGLYKEMYIASRFSGLTHVVAAMERPLRRLLVSYAFPFQPVGPEIDYYGPVRAYRMDIAQWERMLHHRSPSLFAYFVDGLPSHMRPVYARANESVSENESILDVPGYFRA